jgi:hypothetical protein
VFVVNVISSARDPIVSATERRADSTSASQLSKCCASGRVASRLSRAMTSALARRSGAVAA